jgi:D-cysteine desulfhydrase
MPRGGADPLGAVGFHAAARELAGQLDSVRPDDRRISVALAAGSGASAAGLLAGAASLVRPITVLAASVSRPPDETRARVLALAHECAGLVGGAAPRPEDLLLVDARGAGHALPSEAGGRAAELAMATEGLVLDPVYTAKALGALPVLLGERIHDADLTTVFWHTGGLLDAVAGWSR